MVRRLCRALSGGFSFGCEAGLNATNREDDSEQPPAHPLLMRCPSSRRQSMPTQQQRGDPEAVYLCAAAQSSFSCQQYSQEWEEPQKSPSDPFNRLRVRVTSRMNGQENGTDNSRSPSGMTARKATATAKATAGPSTSLRMTAVMGRLCIRGVTADFSAVLLTMRL
jgi:hypothetical protein